MNNLLRIIRPRSLNCTRKINFEFSVLALVVHSLLAGVICIDGS